MPKIEIDKERCKGCQLCILYCPNGCIEIDPSVNKKGLHPVSFKKEDKCSGCSLCGLVCPDVCITVYK
jgi:2-oxoglutarate ferredoxin oxidoreductase subunit delta